MMKPENEHGKKNGAKETFSGQPNMRMGGCAAPLTAKVV